MEFLVSLIKTEIRDMISWILYNSPNALNCSLKPAFISQMQLHFGGIERLNSIL